MKTSDAKRIAIFLDGTWNETGDNTNVWRLKSLCARQADDGKAQVFYYDKGVNGFWGGVFGKGLVANVVEAYEWLVGNYEDGDEIYIFGFSRGAYTARSLAGFIAKYGILKAGAPLGVGQMYDRYKRANDKTIRQLRELAQEGALQNTTLEERWILKYSIAAPVKMVGVWDTVGALGIPLWSIQGLSRSTFQFLHTGLRIPIENGYHALAIDEHRASFAPTLWSVKSTTHAAPRPLSSVEQRWFVGAHANVGGGYHSDLLAQIPLNWMREKARNLGLTFRDRIELDEDSYQAPIADSYKQFMAGNYSRVKKSFDREIGGEPAKGDDFFESNVNETIDGSVFDRWRADANYRPPSLTRWATSRNVDPATTMGPVRADASVENISICR